MSMSSGVSPARWLEAGGPAALGLRLARRLVGPMPTPLRYRIADLGGAGAHAVLRSRAREAARNYAQVLGPDADPEAVARLTRRAFCNYARTVLDFLLLDSLVGELVASGRISGRPHLEQAVARGRGVLLLTAHFGNWDLGAAVAARLGNRVVAVAEPFGRPAVDALVRRARERQGTRIVGTGPAGARAALRALHAGEVVAIVADLATGPAVAHVPFFGQAARLPTGPAALAVRTEAAVLIGSVWRAPDGRYRAAIEPALAVPRNPDRAAAARELTAAIAAVFERLIVARPEQWTAFRPLWPAGGPPLPETR